ESRERLDETERGTIETGAIRRVHVLRRAPPPLLAARDELALDDALRTEKYRDAAIGILESRRHEDADRPLESGLHLGTRDDLAEVRRSDLFLAFGDEHQVHRHFLPRPLDRVQRREERGLRPLLIHRAATDQHLPESGPVDDRGLKWRR